MSYSRFNRYSYDSLSRGDEQDPLGRFFVGVTGKGQLIDHDLRGVSILYQSVDTVRQLYSGIPRSDVYHLLDQIKDAHGSLLTQDQASVLFLSQSDESWIRGNWAIKGSGKRSGYQFILQNNELGIVILYKSYYAPEDREGSHLKIELSPHAIAKRDPEEVQAMLDAIAADFLDKSKPEGVAIHLSVDFQGWQPPMNFLDRLTTRARAMREYQGISSIEFTDLATATVVYGKGESYMIGKANNHQLALYLKSKEIIHSDKQDYFHDVWTEASQGQFDPNKPVWRVESRSHHSVIRELGNFQGENWNTFLAASPYLSDIWRWSLDKTRLNHDAKYIDPFWQLLLDDCDFKRPLLGVFLKRKKKESLGNIGKNISLIVGNLITLMARWDLDHDDVLRDLRKLSVWTDIERYYQSRGIDAGKLAERIAASLLLRRLSGKAA